MIMLYITCKDEAEAKKIAKHLLIKKLIACANIFPTKSLYRWKDKLQEDRETVLIVKSLEKNHKKIESEIKKIHSYGVPCILKFNVDANQEYLRWVKGEC